MNPGWSRTPTYESWKQMKKRCYSPYKSNYHLYGGRGISVCKDWLNRFENFLKDMGERPNRKSLDRINNDEGYSKKNCRWATQSEQNLNRRKGKNNTSGTIGVSFTNKVKKWRAAIRINGVYHFLGEFDSADEAAAARKFTENELL